MALRKSSCLITLFSFLSTTLEQAKAGALESWGWPWRDPDGIHKVFKKHNQLSVWEQRPGGDVNYYLTSLHLDSSISRVRSASFPMQDVKSYLATDTFFTLWLYKKYSSLPEGTSHPRSWIIPSILCLNLTLYSPRSNALVFTIPVFVVTL